MFTVLYNRNSAPYSIKSKLFGNVYGTVHTKVHCTAYNLNCLAVFTVLYIKIQSKLFGNVYGTVQYKIVHCTVYNLYIKFKTVSLNLGMDRFQFFEKLSLCFKNDKEKQITEWSLSKTI